MSDSDDSAGLTPRFALEEGKGTPLGQLPCFTTVGTRGAAAKALESALESLHRFVYGRPGVAGTRRRALEAFQGLPTSVEGEFRSKLKSMTKVKLRDMVMALGMGVHVSLPVEALADGVADFLAAPKDCGKIKPAAAAKTSKTGKTARSSSPAASTPNASQAPAKKAKTETATIALTEGGTPKPKTASQKPPRASPSDAEIQVHVYQRVLRMSPEERQVLGVKALRLELERHFALPEGDLKDRKDLIAETASDCVRALLEAERRAVLVVDTRTTPAPDSVADPAGSPVSPPEPTTSPVPTPHVQQHDAPSFTPQPPAAPAATPQF